MKLRWSTTQQGSVAAHNLNQFELPHQIPTWRETESKQSVITRCKISKHHPWERHTKLVLYNVVWHVIKGTKYITGPYVLAVKMLRHCLDTCKKSYIQHIVTVLYGCLTLYDSSGCKRLASQSFLTTGFKIILIRVVKNYENCSTKSCTKIVFSFLNDNGQITIL